MLKFLRQPVRDGKELMKIFHSLSVIVMGFWGTALADDGAVVIVGDAGATCLQDPHCINRLHPEIEMSATADPGKMIVFNTRNASDFEIIPKPGAPDPRMLGPKASTVHPLTGPVRITGAHRGDILAVTIEKIDPGPFGYTQIGAIGFVSDQIKGRLRVLWKLNEKYAESEALPGVRIPNASFPGVVTVLPGAEELKEILARETALNDSGGAVFGPQPVNAAPAALCGETGAKKLECLRTIPPREFGGNLDTRYLGVGATIYLTCQVEGCGLAIGDVHYAQGDGEVAGTAIEIDAAVTVSTRLITDSDAILKTPHFEGPARLLGIPSKRFYATTGFPIKDKDSSPPDMAYLESPHLAGLENLSKDLSLAARNALLAMIDHISRTYNLTPEQAYIVASVAVDLRIGQVVDAPNVGVSALLPLDIFVEQE